MNGTVPFSDSDQKYLSDLCGMQLDRFSRNVRELHDNGFINHNGPVIIIADGGLGASSPSGEQQQTALLPQASEATQGVVGGGTRPDTSAAVDEVLAEYVDVMQPRTTDFGEEDRREVRACLKLKTVEELKEAIRGNKASAFHQGENDREKKYNTISHIFKGKRGGKSRRENLDYFIDIFRKAMATTGTVKSGVDPAIVAAKKEEVRRAHRLQGDQEAMRRGEEAQKWLAEQGIETRRRSDGYPIWPDTTSARGRSW